MYVNPNVLSLLYKRIIDFEREYGRKPDGILMGKTVYLKFYNEVSKNFRYDKGYGYSNTYCGIPIYLSKHLDANEYHILSNASHGLL